MRIMKDWSSLGLAYLATPYRKFPGGKDAAAAAAAALAARLLAAGVVVYSPVVHSHYISDHAIGFPRHDDDEFWMGHGHIMMGVSRILIVGHLMTWEQSDGIADEVLNFERLGKHIYDCDPATLTLVRRMSRPVGDVFAQFDEPVLSLRRRIFGD